MTSERRPSGLKLIIAYKCVKAPLVLALALTLTLNPRGALHAVDALARDLSEGGALFGRFAHWLETHVTQRAVGHGALLAWLDGVTTTLEAFLLWRGHAWGEWLVVAGLGALVPFELMSLEKHPSWLRLGALLVNAGVVAYLVVLRLRARAPR
ncbi:MAG TPA: DUF2127 domain-containing protein [Polyangiaceae bacterium]|nr:DUF2127 domain-containing protein [Polyangiaceae bacterium]